MAFVDELEVHMTAGRGGNGVVRWRHEKGKEFSGPAGGNAGKGGDVYAKAVRDISILATYRRVKEFTAFRGEDGGSGGRHGANGADLVIKFPVGAVLTNKRTHRVVELIGEGGRVLLLSGGRGGLGNLYFKSSTNTTPYESTKGEAGESADFSIELKLIVDAGFVGLPNAGKSSLLNALTNATAKVGSYAFTTLEPNLGDFYGYILADIPGLIEGASLGKGLGHKFLRHISRTKFLIHCISLEHTDIHIPYRTIRDELGRYSNDLAAKPEIILLTKTDLVSAVELKKIMSVAKKLNKKVYAVSVYDDQSIKIFSEALAKLLT